jgi:HNH endonuclease
MTDISYGYCHCGCGLKTTIAKQTDTRAGYVKGEPHRLIYGHWGYVPLFERFWSKVAITADDNQCWEWQAALDNKGYGQIHFNGRERKAHQIAWIYPDYVIPDRMLICHTCDNPKCCNLKHLFLGTYQDNNRDRAAKGRNNPPMGEYHPRATLTTGQIEAIRNRRSQFKTTYEDIAKEFNISHGCAWDVINFKGRFAIVYGDLKK